MAFGRMSTNAKRPMRSVLACLALLLVTATSAMAGSPAERRGKAFAKANCSRCHAIDHKSASKNEAAPPFRMLHLRYPVETLAEAFAEGIYTGHPDMPAFELEPRQINDLLAYFKSLE
uniref:Cytochrome c, class I n=1 Tax=Rhodopseudomonas palustris (strain BisA53) TaxID=316055 RepID=Q07QU5_RHOP5